MIMKNNTRRNVNLLANHPEGGGLPFRVLVIAESKLELSDEDFSKVEVAANELKDAGVLTYVVAPVSKLTKEEIILKVSEEADVELKDSLTKAELQAKAEALGVEV